MEELIRLNIAFRPPQEIADYAMLLSNQLAQGNQSYFTLDSKHFFPHITVYSPEFPKKNMIQIIDEIEKLSNHSKHLKAHFERFESHQGFIGVKLRLKDDIKNFHNKVISLLNPLRDGITRKKYKDSASNANFTEEQMANIQRFGYPDAGSLYVPHLTVSRLKDEQDARKIAKNLSWPYKEFILDEVAIFTMGDHGTCTHIVNKFTLKKI